MLQKLDESDLKMYSDNEILNNENKTQFRYWTSMLIY